MTFISKAVFLKLLSALAVYAFTLFATNYWGVEVYGKYHLLLVIIQTVSIAYLFGLDSSILQRSINQHKVLIYINEIWFLIFNFIFISLCLTFFLSNYSQVFLIFLSSLTYSFLKVYASIYRSSGFYIKQYFTQSIALYITLILTSFISKNIITNILISLLFISIIFIPLKKARISKSLDPKNTLKGLREIYKKNIHFVSMTLMSVGLFNSDIIILKLFATDEMIGKYALYTRLGFFVIFIWSSISGTAAKELKIEKFNINQMKQKYFRYQMISFFFGLSVFVLCILTGGYIDWAFGAEISGDSALYLVLIAYLLLSAQGPLGTWSIVNGKEKDFSYLNIFCVISNIILNFIFIPSYGGLGAALSTCIVMLLHTAVGYMFIYRRYTNAYT